VGSVPYKGFFDRRAALTAVADLERRGFDAFLRPSPAFSTLGWFDDPVVSTTLEDDSLELANTVIHELTHNTFYASGQASFNESLANFVGSRGAEQFFRSRGDTAAAADVARRWSDEKTMGAFWGWLYDALDSAFHAHPGDDSASRAVRIAARDSIYQAARDSLAGPVALRVRTISAAALAHARLDNAVLLARRVYWTDLDDFDAVYAGYHHDLRRAVRALIDIARSRPDDPFGAVRAAAAPPPH
jgi:predicted aminopeptidase